MSGAFLKSGPSVRAPHAPGSVARAAAGGAGAGGLRVACPLVEGQGPSTAPAPSPRAGQTAGSQGWPLGDFQEFTPHPRAVPPVRRRARFIVRAWGLAHLSDAVEHVVGELASNAVPASAAVLGACPVRVWILADRRRVLVLAWDASPDPPRPAPQDLDAEHGRGLVLVQALSQVWGWYPTPETGGKTVWALVTAEPGAPASRGP
jgi:anti-sigma regulatory factor (Ser/Thr protein kinase)